MGYFSFLYYYNWSYMLFMLPCIILTIVVQASMKSTFNKYGSIHNSRGLTGYEAASRLLSSCGVTGVRIERVSGSYTDHFDPRTNVIRSRSRGSARPRLFPEQGAFRDSACR